MLDLGSPKDRPIHVLLIDDDQSEFVMTESLLSRVGAGTIQLSWVSSYEEAVQALERDEHDLYLVDYMLGDRNGLELIRAAKNLGVHSPLIMLTGKGGREIDMEAMEAGAADYLVKGKLDPELMERSIRYALERSRTEAALRESERRHRQFFDHLPIGLHRTTPAGEVVDANPALAETLGYPDRETLRTRYAANLYVKPEERERFMELLEQDGQVVGFETELQRFDGKTIRVRNSARAVRSTDGEVIYIEGVVEDLSERAG